MDTTHGCALVYRVGVLYGRPTVEGLSRGTFFSMTVPASGALHTASDAARMASSRLFHCLGTPASLWHYLSGALADTGLSFGLIRPPEYDCCTVKKKERSPEDTRFPRLILSNGMIWNNRSRQRRHIRHLRRHISADAAHSHPEWRASCQHQTTSSHSRPSSPRS